MWAGNYSRTTTIHPEYCWPALHRQELRAAYYNHFSFLSPLSVKIESEKNLVVEDEEYEASGWES